MLILPLCPHKAFTQNYNYTFQSPGTYSLTLIAYYNQIQCSDTAYATVIVEDSLQWWMPNVFSPNNDKINDLFVIYPHYYKSVTWQIYDRWGNLMHKASEEIKPQKNDEIILWNGKVNEKEASAGTYYYTIELLHSSGKSKTLKGFISLVK